MDTTPLLIYRNDRLATRSTCKAYVIFVSVFGCWVSFLGGFFGWLYFIFFSYRVLRLMSAPDPLEIIIPLYFSVGFFLFLRLVLFCLFSRTVPTDSVCKCAFLFLFVCCLVYQSAWLMTKANNIFFYIFGTFGLVTIRKRVRGFKMRVMTVWLCLVFKYRWCAQHLIPTMFLFF